MIQHKFLATATFTLLGAALAAQTKSVLPYLPKNTLFAVSAPDLVSTAKQFQQTPLAKMWNEEEMQTFLADALEFANEKWEEGRVQAKEAHAQGMMPVDPDQLLKLRCGGVTAAVTQLDIAMGDWGPQPTIGLILHIDFADSGQTWNGLIQMGLGMLQGVAGDEMEKTESKIGEVPFISMMPTDPNAPENMGLNVAMVPNGILIGTIPGEVKAIVEAMNAQTPLLGGTPLYTKLAAKTNAPGAEVESFVHIDPIMEFAITALTMATEMEPDLAMVDMDGVQRALLAMGLRNLGAMAATGSYVGGKCITRTYHALDSRQGLTAASGKSLDMGFLKWVPKDAVSFSAWSWNVASLYDTVVKGLEAYDPEMARMALGQLGKVEEQLGFKVREDLFGSFGDHAISWSMAVSTIASMPETALLLAIKDQDKLVTVLRNMAQLSDGMVEFEEGERRGIKVYSLRVNWDPTQGMGMNPFDMFTPTFSFKDGYLVAGFSVGDIKRVFKRMDREDDPKGDVRSNKEFAAIAATIPASVNSVSFIDWKTDFESLYQLATGMLALVPIGEDVPIDMSLLPDSGTLTQHLFASVSYSTSDANGDETVNISPWGPEVGLLVGAAIGAGAAAFVGF